MSEFVSGSDGTTRNIYIIITENHHSGCCARKAATHGNVEIGLLHEASSVQWMEGQKHTETEHSFRTRM